MLPFAASTMPLRLAAVVSHPIQYQAPLFRHVAATSGVELTVFFLSDHGVKPTFDAGFGRALQYDVPLLEGYRHRFVPNVSLEPSVSKPLGLVNPRLALELARGKFDAVWVHGYAHASDWIAFATAAATHTPILLRGDSTALHETTLAKRLVKRAVLTPLVKGAKGLLYVGEQNRRYWEALGAKPEQLFFTPYSVDNAYFAARAREAVAQGRREELRARIGAGTDDVVLLFCGKLIACKRTPDLVEAVRLLGDAGKRVVLAFVGDGDERLALERAIAAGGVRAALVGFQNQSELPAWYAASELLVLPSDAEQWGLVVNEAMAAGLPVVASDLVGCASDLIEGKGTGAVHRAGDVRSLAAALRPLIEDAALRRKASERARKMIGRYDVSETARGVVQALETVAKKR